ncbi:MAG: pyrroline-5-carboxylate reductase [Sphingomicrobium sp.]
MSDSPRLPAPTWFVGCGNMGGAIIEGLRAAGFDLADAVIVDPRPPSVEGVRAVRSAAEAGSPPKLVILGVKPQLLDEVAPQLRTYLSAKTVLVSILAGVEASSLRRRFPGVSSVVRAMPNLAVAVRRGVIGLYSEDVDERTQQVGDLFSALGWAMWTVDEARLAALGSVAGAGPAYVARFVQALAEAAEQQGLSREIASTIALETVLGTVWMAATTGESMDAIVRRVASPNGTTETGLKVLDAEQGLRALVARTIDAAARRGNELAGEAKLASLEEPERLS